MPPAADHGTATASGAPQLILCGGSVLTLDPRSSVASAVAVRGGRIAAVGSDAEIRALAGPGTRLVELAGRTVLPGINDSHLHAAAYAMSRPPFALDVGHPAVASIADIVAVVRAAAAQAAPGEWITGLGWDPGYLAECLADPSRLPHRRDLDMAAPDNPVCLGDFSAHRVWANSAALLACGVGRGTEPPVGGVIDRDADGEPSGILREAAQSLIQRRLPPPTPERRRAAIRSVVAELHARGITSYTEPGLGPGGTEILFGGLGSENLAAYQQLDASGELDARVSVLVLPAAIGGSARDVHENLAELPRPRLAGPDGRLSVIGVKIFGDGVPPNRTAWMHEPYVGGGHGSLCVHGATAGLQAEELREMIRAAHEAGYQVGVHATGDRAIDAVVDAFEDAERGCPRPDPRHYVIHGDFVSARTLARMAARGYGVNMNPGIKWMTSDVMPEVVGERRSAYQWPVKSAFDAGVAVCASSDAPVTEPDWRQGVAGMLLRRSRASGRPSGPEQCVDLERALRAYTVNAARQDFAEAWKGSVETGKVADLCVLDRDLMATGPERIPEVGVVMTVFDGRVVYEA